MRKMIEARSKRYNIEVTYNPDGSYTIAGETYTIAARALIALDTIAWAATKGGMQ